MENGGPAGSEAASILEAGTRLGNYEIRRLIGLGSMSAIYEGTRPDTGKRVAIKVLSPKRAIVPGARARFLTEAKLTARVRHDHIVDVIEVGEDGERSYLAMEMLEGEDLGRRLRHSTFLSAAETADILVPVCEAVAAAHSSGIVHRDLKPSNIFLAIRDQKTHPVILDFGIANDNDATGSEAGPGKGAGAASGSRLVFGTPYYLSPEQIVDHSSASPASDQWALGVILYECLTGVRPFDGDSLDDVFGAIRAGKALPPGARRPGIPPELEKVVMRAMSTDPKARFASVGELAEALRPFVSGVGEAKAPSRRRAPSSPAIALEASTQSPFTRTLTPEVDVLDGLWFEPDPDESAGNETLPQATLASQQARQLARHEDGHETRQEASLALAERPDSNEAWLTFASRWTERWRSTSGRRLSGRRIGAVAGGALGGLVLLFLITHGGSAQRGGSQPPAPVSAHAIEPSGGVPAVPAIGQGIAAPAVADSPASSGSPAVTAPPAPMKEAPVASAPSREPEKEIPVAKEAASSKEPTAPSSLSAPQGSTAPQEPTVAKEPPPAKEPTPVKGLTAVKEPTAVKELTAVKEPAVVKQPRVVKEPVAMEPVAKPPVTPAAIRLPKPERHDRPAPALTAAPATTGAAPHDVTEKPRARTNPEVRMHKGVPLLD